MLLLLLGSRLVLGARSAAGVVRTRVPWRDACACPSTCAPTGSAASYAALHVATALPAAVAVCTCFMLAWGAELVRHMSRWFDFLGEHSIGVAVL